jgi:hypothetical protein
MESCMHQNRLSFRFLPFPNEAYHGYLARLALDNGFSTTPVMLRWAQENLGLRSKDSAENVLRTLTQHSDAKLENISLKGPGPGKRRMHKIFGRDISHLWFRPRRECYICPQCTEQLNSTKLSWQFSWTKTCVIHECALISSCTRCASPISYDKAARNRCGCGATFQSERARCEIQLAFDKAVELCIDAKQIPDISIKVIDSKTTTQRYAYLEYEAKLGNLCASFRRFARVS